MKPFSSDVIKWWVKWTNICHNQDIEMDEAENELKTLRELVEALKNYRK